MNTFVKRALALLAPAVLLATAMPSIAHAVGNCGIYRIQAASGYYVTAETGRSSYEGMLRARTPANALGTWEEFKIQEYVFNGSSTFSFKAHNGKYVDTWASYPGSLKGMLRASASNDNNPDQKFAFPTNVIPAGLTTFHSLLNGPNWFVSAEEGYTGDQWGMLRARTPGTATGNWEKFDFQRIRGC